MKNLIVAGRCTSVNEPLWDVMRVIPCCAVTGQAAGIAAAMTDDFASLDVTKLQKKLTEAAKENGWDIEVVCSKVNGQTFWTA